MTTVQTWDEDGVVCKWKDILKNQEVFTGDTAEKGSKLGSPVGRWGWRSRPAAPECPCMSPAPACPPTLPHLSHAGRKPAQAVGFSARGRTRDLVRAGRLGQGLGWEAYGWDVTVSLQGSRRKWLHWALMGPNQTSAIPYISHTYV